MAIGGAAVEAGRAKLAGASLDFRSRSGEWARWGLRSNYCPASSGDQPLSFECAVLTRLVPEHFGKMWKIYVIGELCAYDLHSRMARNSKRNWETSKTP
jgi:hypothetical protein